MEKTGEDALVVRNSATLKVVGMFHEIATVVSRRQLIRATTDEQAAAAWVAHHKSKATKANCQKESFRFLLWCRNRDLTLNTLYAEDLMAYAVFLADPQPAEQWISKKRFPQADPRWRPFQGPLSPASQRQAMIAVASMLGWLHQSGYLELNPGRLIKIDKVYRGKQERHIPWSSIAYMLDAIELMPGKTGLQIAKKARNRFLVALFTLTAARLSDAPGAVMGSIRPNQRKSWWWHVRGKGNKDAKIPVPDDLVIEYKRYRAAMGLPELPQVAEDRESPLLPVLRGKGPADEITLYVAIKEIMGLAASLAETQGDPESAIFLRKASPHFLRHTALTRQADEKIDLRWIQANGRHEDINTTMGYLHGDDEDRHKATNKIMKLRGDK